MLSLSPVLVPSQNSDKLIIRSRLRAIAKYKVLRAIVKYDMDGRKIEPLLTSNNGGLVYSSREPAVNVYTTQEVNF